MKVKVCSYSRSIETMYGYGLKRWDKAGCEIELESGDSSENAFSMAVQLVNEQLDKAMPDESMRGTKVVTVSERPTDTKEALIFDINNCTDVKILSTYEFLSRKYPEIQSAYETKLKQLTNGL